jgi:putative chitinase
MGNLTSADALTYRGRGAIMLTGRENYSAAGAALGLPLVAHPHLAAVPEHAGRIAAWYLRERVLPHVTDPAATGDVRRRINGGLVGIDDVATLLRRILAEISAAVLAGEITQRR